MENQETRRKDPEKAQSQHCYVALASFHTALRGISSVRVMGHPPLPVWLPEKVLPLPIISPWSHIHPPPEKSTTKPEKYKTEAHGITWNIVFGGPGLNHPHRRKSLDQCGTHAYARRMEEWVQTPRPGQLDSCPCSSVTAWISLQVR